MAYSKRGRVSDGNYKPPSVLPRSSSAPQLQRAGRPASRPASFPNNLRPRGVSASGTRQHVQHGLGVHKCGCQSNTVLSFDDVYLLARQRARLSRPSSGFALHVTSPKSRPSASGAFAAEGIWAASAVKAWTPGGRSDTSESGVSFAASAQPQWTPTRMRPATVGWQSRRNVPADCSSTSLASSYRFKVGLSRAEGCEGALSPRPRSASSARESPRSQESHLPAVHSACRQPAVRRPAVVKRPRPAQAPSAPLAEEASPPPQETPEADVKLRRVFWRQRFNQAEQFEFPSCKEILERLFGSEKGFSRKTQVRIQQAFTRFKVPGGHEVHMDDVDELLHYLGHVMTEPDQLIPLVRQVTEYDYIDFNEFLNFLHLYVPWEKAQIQIFFNEFDDDGSGEISVSELRKLMSALGFSPLRGMVEEALKLVDENGSRALDFEELCTFLAVYQYTEGFTLSEVAELRFSFNRYSKGTGETATLPPEDLSDALVLVFGLSISEFALKLTEQLTSGQGLTKSSFAASRDVPETLAFAEFLVFARKIREAQLDQLKHDHPDWAPRAFNKSDQAEFIGLDQDGNGLISETELKHILGTMDYTPLKPVLDQIFSIIADGPWTSDRELDFDEFFDFMRLYIQREGFTKAEMDDLIEAFERFDNDGSGEISVVELDQMLRHLGYAVKLDDIRDLVAKVDENSSGQLDVREFLKLMRLFRQRDLVGVKKTFNACARHTTGLLPVKDLANALKELGHDVSEDIIQSAPADMDFDAFVALVDAQRAVFVKKERKKCGFDDEEMFNLYESFSCFDQNNSGDIDVLELEHVLREFGWQPRSKTEQIDLCRKIEEARSLSCEAGIPDVGEVGSATITFWVFVRLARTLRNEKTEAEEKLLEELQTELDFSKGEVEQFRHIFRSRVTQFIEIAKVSGIAVNPSAEVLCGDAIRRLIRSMGLSASSTEKDALTTKMASLDARGRRENPEIDLGKFLRLMRWMLDVNFAGIKEATQKERKESETP